jgi:hypothetical protein
VVVSLAALFLSVVASSTHCTTPLAGSSSLSLFAPALLFFYDLV